MNFHPYIAESSDAKPLCFCDCHRKIMTVMASEADRAVGITRKCKRMAKGSQSASDSSSWLSCCSNFGGGVNEMVAGCEIVVVTSDVDDCWFWTWCAGLSKVSGRSTSMLPVQKLCAMFPDADRA
jgi:hypothetical protein